ncbi:MAG: hypothetical protein ABL908_20370, partial [Hyphomicrobium sp.]
GGGAEAGAIIRRVSRQSGSAKLHFPNAVPIRTMRDRWISNCGDRQVSALPNLTVKLDRKD